MKTNKKSLNIIICSFILFIISIITIYCSNSLNLYIKQIIYYILGFIITIFITYKGFNLLKKYHFIIYIGINILLLALLLFGKDINGSKCWIFLGPFSFQPSELMKISLIISFSMITDKFHKKNQNKTMKDEFIFLIKISIILLIPSILTLLEPDTGVVIIYFVIFLTLLFICNLNKKWYLIFLLFLIFIIGVFLLLYLFNQEIIFNILGNNIFYRIERIINWVSNSGYQLENSLIAISTSGLTGFGFNSNIVYFPEGHTDFIFTTFVSNFGFIGVIFLICIIIIFNQNILKISLGKISRSNKYIIILIFIMILYQQIQNISMTIGLLPITGITLPYISYGGSSLLSYMLVLGIVLNINHESLKYRN